MDYLQEDVPGLEVEYDKFLERVEEETEDPQWNIDNHPAREILHRFSAGFSQWVQYLFSLSLMRRGGCPFGINDLSVLEWKALAVLENFIKKSQARSDG